MAIFVIFFVLNLHVALSALPPRSRHIRADHDAILHLLDEYVTDSLELRERVKGNEGLLILRDSAQNGEGVSYSDRSSSNTATDAQSTDRNINPGSASGQFSGSNNSGDGMGSTSESDGSASGGKSGDGMGSESDGSSGSASGGSAGSGSADSLEPSAEELFQQWLSEELLKMTTVVYDCKDGNEIIGDWRNESVGDWLMEWSSSHTSDSASASLGSGSGPDEPKEREERFIFGEDEREFVTHSRDFPQCAIARVSTGCTAFFIGPYHALTAAHCVNNFRYGWRRRVQLWRERNCHDKGINSVCSRVFAVFGHTHLKMYDYDYALIELERNGDPAPCWFGIGYINPWAYPSYANLEVLGYPFDKRWYTGQPECTYEAMWLSSCNTSYSIRQNLLQWCDAVSGNSGSPVFSDTNQNKVVYGIHAQSIGKYVYNDDGGREIEELWNQGPMITPLRYYQILRWMKLSD